MSRPDAVNRAVPKDVEAKVRSKPLELMRGLKASAREKLSSEDVDEALAKATHRKDPFRQKNRRCAAYSQREEAERMKASLNLYRRLRLSVIPLLYRSKKPLVPWKEFQSRQPTEEELRNWFGGDSPRNIGVVCGSVSGNLGIFDFDEKAAYFKFFPDHERLERATIVAESSRGIHVYLRSLERVETFRIPELHLDVKGEGSFVVAPPSVHPSGCVYRFLNPEVEGILEVCNLEKSIWRRAGELGVKGVLPRLHDVDRARRASRQLYAGPHPLCIRAMLRGVELGYRDDAGVRLAQHFHVARGLPVEETVRLLLKWNLKNRPPIGQHGGDRRDVEAYFLEKVLSAEKSQDFGCRSLQTVSGLCCGRDQCEFFQSKKRRKKEWQITISHTT